MKYVKSLDDLPNDKPYYMVLYRETYSYDDGYDSHSTGSYLAQIVFNDKPELEKWVSQNVTKTFKVTFVNPMAVKITTNIELI